MGALYLEIGDFQRAINHLEEVIETCSHNPDKWEILLGAYILSADAYGSMDYVKYRDKIFDWLQKADSLINMKNLNVSFEKNQVRIIRGNLLLRIDDYTRAIGEYENVISNSNFFFPEELAIVCNNLGFCLLKSKDFKNAEEQLRKSISLDPSYTDSYENLGICIFKKKSLKKESLIIKKQSLKQWVGINWLILPACQLMKI